MFEDTFRKYDILRHTYYGISAFIGNDMLFSYKTVRSKYSDVSLVCIYVTKSVILKQADAAPGSKRNNWITTALWTLNLT